MRLSEKFSCHFAKQGHVRHLLAARLARLKKKSTHTTSPRNRKEMTQYNRIGCRDFVSVRSQSSASRQGAGVGRRFASPERNTRKYTRERTSAKHGHGEHCRIKV